MAPNIWSCLTTTISKDLHVGRPQQSSIDIAHKRLSYCVHAMRNMVPLSALLLAKLEMLEG
jgi:hypothetical protein